MLVPIDLCRLKHLHRLINDHSSFQPSVVIPAHAAIQ